MSISSILILILIGVAAGSLGGLVGVGGGIIMVPAMVYFLNSSQLQAQGTSLIVMMMPVGALGVYNYYVKGNLAVSDMQNALIIALGFIFGSYFGSQLANSTLPVPMIKKAFASLMIIVGIKMLFGK
jgi:uncharacterized membrane protein YfcA